MTLIDELLPPQREDAISIISHAALSNDEDRVLRYGSHDFSEGIAWGLCLTLASLRGMDCDDAWSTLVGRGKEGAQS